MSLYEMAQGLLNNVEAHAFEVISILISLATLIYAALAFKTAKQAIHIAKESDATALRLKAQNAYSAAEKSFNELQRCGARTREQWKQHIDRHYPPLRPDFGSPEETVHIARLETEGRRLLQELWEAITASDSYSAADFERLIRRAHATALQIERLTLDLKAPTALGR